jgi:PAS domain S-box-containing protein
MLELLRRLFSSDGFMPHGHCYLWDPRIVWLHVISDGLTALAYTTIPFTLLYLARKRRETPFNWMFVCFGTFIIACGATHALDVWTLWTPTYWLSGGVKAVTAIASVSTAFLLVRLVPKVLAIPTAAQLATAHEELRRAHEALESRVVERTAALTRKNEELALEIVERKQAEAVARVSEARKTAMMEAALDAIVLMNHEGAIVDLNPAAQEIFGYSRADAVGRALADLIVPARLRDKHRAGLARYLAKGEATILGRRLELDALRSDGTEFPVELAVVRVETEGPPMFTGYIRDITERRRSADALRASEARFVHLSESGILGILLADTSGKAHEVNDAFVDLVGYSREELCADSFRITALTPPEWNEAQEVARRQLLSSGVARPWEKEFIRKDGTRVPVLIGVTQLSPSECLCVVLDLTEQKKAEEAIRGLREKGEADAKFKALLEAAPDAMVIVDDAARIVLINAQAETLFGYSREELLGNSVDTLVPERHRAVHPAHRARYFADAKVRRMGAGLALFGRRKNGSEFPVEISLSPLHTKGGLLVSSAIRDISERMRVEAELRRAKETAEAASRELEAFSYSVAHDLRAPLRAVNGYSAALTEDLGDELGPEATDQLTRIGAAAGRMGHLIDALLELARTSRAELARERVSLSDEARAVLAHLAASEPERVVELVIADGLVVHGDPRLLRVLLENTLGNAWKFTSRRAAARVEVGLSEADGARAYFVRDNGAGFDMEYAAKLFAPFQRLHKASEFPGTGIGLATVQRIVQRHGGSCWAEGAVEEGATFFFTLGAATGTDS